jgi:sugar fermentation stimulation protein A
MHIETELSLNFEKRPRQAVFVERPNRFLVRCRLMPTEGDCSRSRTGENPEGPLVEAHLPDPGRLKELLLPGRSIWIIPADKPERKTAWSVALCETPDGRGLISLDSTLPNRLIEKALTAGGMDEFKCWRFLRREYRAGRSRWDFLLEHREKTPPRQMALEIKSVTLVEIGVALFPDAVTERGTRHVRELSELARTKGWAAAVLFVVQREDACAFRPAAHLDPAFAANLKEAVHAGVKVFCRKCRVTPGAIKLAEKLPVLLDG